MSTPPTFSSGQVLTSSAMNSVGLWLVTSVTVGSGVSTVNVPNAFNVDFDNYRIILSNIDSNIDGNGIKLKLDGITSAVYSSGFTTQTYAAVDPTGGGYANDAGGVFIGYTSTTNDIDSFIDICSPFIAQRKTYTFQSSSANYISTGGGYINSTSQATGFTIDPDAAATLTGGVIRCYGYRN